MPHYKYASAAQETLFYRQPPERVRSTPGGKSAGIEQPGGNVFIQPEGQPPAAAGQELTAGFNVVTQGRFTTTGIGLVAGREFSESDADGSTAVAIISETVARRYWPRSNPLGSHLTDGCEQHAAARPVRRALPGVKAFGILLRDPPGELVCQDVIADPQ